MTCAFKLQEVSALNTFKGRDQQDMVVELKSQYFVEINFRIHLIQMMRMYCVQFLNKSVKSFVIFHLFFQSAEETFFLQFLNSMDKTCVEGRL